MSYINGLLVQEFKRLLIVKYRLRRNAEYTYTRLIHIIEDDDWTPLILHAADAVVGYRDAGRREAKTVAMHVVAWHGMA